MSLAATRHRPVKEGPPDEGVLQRRIRQRLRELDTNPYRAAVEAGLHPDTFRTVLRPGKTDHPRLDTLQAMARALDCGVAWLIGDDDAVTAALEAEAPAADPDFDQTHPAADAAAGQGGCIVIFQLGGPVLGAGPEPARVEARVRERLGRFGKFALPLKLPEGDAGLDIRATAIRVWGEDRLVTGALYRAPCDEALAERIILGARLEVPPNATPDAPLLTRAAPRRLTLTGPVVALDEARAESAPDFTVDDVLKLREWKTGQVTLPVAQQAFALAQSRALSALARLGVSGDSAPDPGWLAKAARALRGAAEAVELALRFGAEQTGPKP